MAEHTAVVDLDTPLILVTADSHIGPRVKEDLREYCPKQHLDEYDEWVRVADPDPESVFRELSRHEGADGIPRNSIVYEKFRDNATAGHHDVHERLKDMDRDGVAAEVIYHGSQNGECFPFVDPAGGTFNALVFSPVGSAHELELMAVGQHMYNRWLADQCSVEPERHVGLAHLPMWDIEAAVREVEWASEAGLRGVNLPGPKLGIKRYDDPAWNAFWSVCEERGLALSTHDGAQFDDVEVQGPHSLLVIQMEELAPRLLPRIVFGGVFERHPELRLALTELQVPLSVWWTKMTHRYDELWEANRAGLKGQVPRPPSEYLSSHIFLGQSLLHEVPQEATIPIPKEITIAMRDGYAGNILWGSDYPHMEGSYHHPKVDVGETSTVLGLRHAYSQVPAPLAKRIVGETAVEVYGLDRDKLAAVARRIGAITSRHLGTPLETVPDEWRLMADTLVFPEYHHQGAA